MYNRYISVLCNTKADNRELMTYYSVPKNVYSFQFNAVNYKCYKYAVSHFSVKIYTMAY